jgi:putative oxidoreductase
MTVQSSETPSSTSILSCCDGMAAQWQDALLLVGRVLMGWIFVQSGWRKLMDVPGFVATMPRRGLPDFLGYVAPPVEFLGGLALLLGGATRYAALLMLLFTSLARSPRTASGPSPTRRSTAPSTHSSGRTCP